MQQEKLTIKFIGFLIMIFAATHLFLNLYVISLPFILKPDKLQKLIQMLTRAFGPIAIREDMNMAMLFVKVMVSALFLSSGIGIMKFKGWARKLLFLLLIMRIIYGSAICAGYNVFHAHLLIMIVVGLFLFYYFTRPKIKEQFR